MSRIKTHHTQLSLQYQEYKKSCPNPMSWNEFQKQLIPSKKDTDYIALMEYVKNHKLIDKKSLESIYNRIKKLLDVYAQEAQSIYEKYVLSAYEDATTEAHYKMIKLRVNKLSNMLNCVFKTYMEYTQMQEDKHAKIDKSFMEGIGRYYLDDDDEN